VLQGLLDDLASQRAYVAERAPVYERILAVLPDVLPLDRLAEVWAERSFGAWYERPLLLLASLRADALAEGPSHPLFAAIGAEADLAAATPDAVATALTPDRAVWESLRHRHVQTNETTRAVAWLWPAHLLAETDPRARLQIFDVGTSAGLNLVADALSRIWTRPGGEPLVLDPLPEITLRRGYDLRPVDVTDEDHARWLRACVWPGQETRQRRLEAAIAAWRASDPRPDFVTASAEEVPGLLPSAAPPHIRMLAFQTVMRDYLPDDERRRYQEGMHEWVAAHDPGVALWVELEVTEAAREGGPPAAITVHVAGETLRLATCDPHPSVIDVAPEGVGTLRRLLHSR